MFCFGCEVWEEWILITAIIAQFRAAPRLAASGECASTLHPRRWRLIRIGIDTTTDIADNPYKFRDVR